MDSIIYNCSYLDVRTGDILPDAVICIRNNVVVSIEPSLHSPLPDYDVVVNAKGGWVLPGLIDVHLHIFEEPSIEAFPQFSFDEPSIIAGMRAAKNLLHCLNAGITLVRDVGAYQGRNILARLAIEIGAFPGPRILACGHHITCPDGHFWTRGRQVAGVASLKAAVAEEIAAGADFIKVMNDDIGFYEDEMSAIVEAAHHLGKKVACHAFTREAVQIALDAKVDTIEHAAEFNETMIEQMLAQGTIIVPTYVAAYDAVRDIEASKVEELFPDTSPEEFYQWLEWENMNIPRAFAAGVKIAAGSDAGFPLTDFDSVKREVQFFVELGATPLQAIQSCTLIAAEALGLEDRLGEVRPGKLADIVIVPENPLKDIGVLHQVELVMLDGQIVKNTL